MERPPAHAAQRKRQDTLHVGATRPAMFLGLPVKLTLLLLGSAYIVAVNVSLLWAAAFLVPAYVGARLAVRRSFYGINILFVWAQTSLASYLSPFSDRWIWGGASRAPLPSRFQTRSKGMRRVR